MGLELRESSMLAITPLIRLWGLNYASRAC